MVSWCKKGESYTQISPKSELCKFKWANTHSTPLCISYAKVPDYYGPYAYCSLDKASHAQSYVDSGGQTLTKNVSMTLCNWQSCHQTHVLCGCTTFGTRSN